MRYEERLERLPSGLAIALRMERAECDDEVIATALDVPVESVQVLLRIAHAKLQSLDAESCSD